MATRKAQPLNTNTSASTSVAVRKPSNGSIVSIKDAIAAQIAAMGDRIAPPGGNKIKLAAGSMTLPDGTKTPGPLQLVIVDFVSRNMFYEGPYDQNNISPPACFAIGTNPLKLVPSKNAPLPQAKSCAECPMNQFGSSGKGKACKNERSLAVLPPDADADTPLWVLNVSPTGLKGFDSYVANLARSLQTIPADVITTVSLDENESYPKLVFSDPTPNGKVAEHFARQAEAQAMLAVEPDVSGYGIEKPPAKAAPKRPAVRR
jgi:hypothetical protein